MKPDLGRVNQLVHQIRIMIDSACILTTVSEIEGCREIGDDLEDKMVKAASRVLGNRHPDSDVTFADLPLLLEAYLRVGLEFLEKAK